MTPFEQLRKDLKERQEAYRMSTGAAGDPLEDSTPKAVETGIRLGDIVEKVAEAVIGFLGIPKPKGCGCKRRKEFLNDLV